MSTVGKGTKVRAVMTINGLPGYASDSDVAIKAEFYMKGKKSTETTIIFNKAGAAASTETTLIKQYTSNPDENSNDYMAIVDTGKFSSLGNVACELTIAYTDTDGNRIIEVIPNVSTGITTIESS